LYSTKKHHYGKPLSLGVSTYIMKYKILVILLFISHTSYSDSEGKLLVLLPDYFTFKVPLTKACDSKPNLPICKNAESRSGNITLYCNTLKYNCNNVQNMHTVLEFIASERSIDIECIATIENTIKKKMVRELILFLIRLSVTVSANKLHQRKNISSGCASTYISAVHGVMFLKSHG
jgi:hypothetical protein